MFNYSEDPQHKEQRPTRLFPVHMRILPAMLVDLFKLPASVPHLLFKEKRMV
ncbi:hypothetical protein FHT67_004391 [Paenibacillus sp. BK720]|nr:hypothetical protein [Paenibacillus sp. BK720]